MGAAIRWTAKIGKYGKMVNHTHPRFGSFDACVLPRCVLGPLSVVYGEPLNPICSWKWQGGESTQDSQASLRSVLHQSTWQLEVRGFLSFLYLGG